MATVAVLEAGTYAYMAWRYETPVSVVAWALILSRALAAPLLSVYLAMARPLPVTARDILAQVELASGLGLIRDAVTIANDAAASLSQKVALFGASAVMTPQDRERLDGLLAAVERGQREAPEGVPVLEAPEAAERAELRKAAQNGHAPLWRWGRVARRPGHEETTHTRGDGRLACADGAAGLRGPWPDAKGTRASVVLPRGETTANTVA